jgi:phasin
MNVMIEAATATSKTTKANPVASPFGLSKFEMAKMDVPAEFREMTNKGLAHARDAFVKAKVASEEATDLLQNTYMTVATGATNYNLNVIAIARTNTRAAFDCAHELLSAKSLPEFVELSTAHARKQFETVTEQGKELTAIAQKVATDTVEPLKTGVTKAFGKVAA